MKTRELINMAADLASKHPMSNAILNTSIGLADTLMDKGCVEAAREEICNGIQAWFEYETQTPMFTKEGFVTERLGAHLYKNQD